MGEYKMPSQEAPLIFDVHWRDKDFLYRGLGGRISGNKGVEELGGHAYWVQVEARKFYVPGRPPENAIITAVEVYLGESEEKLYSYGE